MIEKDVLRGDGSTIVDGVELKAEERQECEVWTRVMGYYRPVSQYNTGKRGEFHERVEFEEPVGKDAANQEESSQTPDDDK